MNKIIIAFAGKAGAGKDTAASFIKNDNIDNVEVFAFAEPIKAASKILFNFSDDQLHCPVKKEELDDRWNKTPRQIFQWLGTDVIRKHIRDDFFLINMKNRITESKCNVIIITDVRFTNESKFIKDLGGKIFKIVRPGGKTTKYNDHPTENGIPDEYIDDIITNDGTRENFKKSVYNHLLQAGLPFLTSA